MSEMPQPLEFEDLEEVYCTIAEAIDTVGSERETVFLAKLSLILARMIGRPNMVAEAIAIAKRDLDSTE